MRSGRCLDFLNGPVLRVDATAQPLSAARPSAVEIALVVASRTAVTSASLARIRLASADLLGEGDDDACGAADVAEPEDALVLRHLAEEFGIVGV